MPMSLMKLVVKEVGRLFLKRNAVPIEVVCKVLKNMIHARKANDAVQASHMGWSMNICCGHVIIVVVVSNNLNPLGTCAPVV